MSYYRYSGFYQVLRESSNPVVSGYVSLLLWLFANAAIEVRVSLSERQIINEIDETIQHYISKTEHP